MIVLSPLLMAILLYRIGFREGKLMSDVSLMAFIISQTQQHCVQALILPYYTYLFGSPKSP